MGGWTEGWDRLTYSLDGSPMLPLAVGAAVSAPSGFSCCFPSSLGKPPCPGRALHAQGAPGPVQRGDPLEGVHQPPRPAIPESRLSGQLTTGGANRTLISQPLTSGGLITQMDFPGFN